MSGRGGKAMVHRLLVMNIDDTVLQPNGKVNRSTKDAIEYVQSRGVKVSLVTSRNFNFAKKVAKALSIESLLIAHHGAFIASSVDSAIFVKRIDEVIVQEITRFLEKFPCEIRAIDEKITVTNKPFKNNSFIGRIVFDPANNQAYQYQYADDLSEYIMNTDIQPTHFEVLFTNEKDAKDVKEIIHKIYDEVDAYLYGNKLIILPKGVSKFSSLLYALDYWNISLKEVVAIGSGVDDLDILLAADVGVAMGNAPHELKRNADWITRSNKNDGVAYMIMEHFRKQQPLSFLEKISNIKK